MASSKSSFVSNRNGVKPRKTWRSRTGLACPRCDSRHSFLVDSRPSKEGDAIRRRRECECGHRYTTYEMVYVPSDEIEPQRTLADLATELALRLSEGEE